MSAARLAAESAFAAPTVAETPQPAVQVVVRKARSAMAAHQSDLGSEDHAEAASPAKPARVFLIRPAAARQEPQGSPTATAAAAPRARPASRSHRAQPDKRPGPLVLVTPARVEPPEPQADANPLQASDLLAALAQLTPVLEMIAHAQAFTLADAGVDEEWLRLSRRLQSLQAQIQAR